MNKKIKQIRNRISGSNHHTLVLIRTGLVFIFLVVASSSIWLPYLVSHPFQSFHVSDDLQQSFIEQFANTADINNGITIYIISYYSHPSETSVGEFLEFAVLNHTEEDIIFSDNGFGLKILTVDDILHNWQEIIPLIHPDNNPHILLAQTNSFTSTSNNSYYLRYSDFNSALPTQLRILVSGIGKSSQKSYIAYIDLSRK